MGYIVFMVVVFLVAVGAWRLSRFVTRFVLADSALGGAQKKEQVERVADYSRSVAIALFAVFALLFTLFSSLHLVPAGHVGLVYTFGDITGQRDAGLQITAPWQGFKTATIQVQRIRPDTKCANDHENCLEAFSQETQDVFIQPTLNISVNPTEVQDLYRNIGPDYLSKIVRPRLLQIFKDEIVKLRSVDIAPARELIRAAVRDRLRAELAPFSITVEDLLIDNLDFRPEFKQAIEAKQIASQEALRQQELVAAREAEARGVAATAQGVADRLRIEAEGQAEANRLINASLTPLLIQFQALQKLADNVQIALIPSGQGLIIDPTTLFEPRP